MTESPGRERRQAGAVAPKGHPGPGRRWPQSGEASGVEVIFEASLKGRGAQPSPGNERKFIWWKNGILDRETARVKAQAVCRFADERNLGLRGRQRAQQAKGLEIIL